MKKWIISQLNREKAAEISEIYNLPTIVAMLLVIRGFDNEDSILSFLYDDNELFDPFLIMDIDKATSRIHRAINSNERICIYGDYDADGVTSTSLLYLYLLEQSANVMYYIPSREKEGYGINKGAIDYLKEQGVVLLITVDNGISAVEEIDYAYSLGIDTIITDHHTVPKILPNAVAVVNLHRADCDSPFKEFSGVGVVFKLIMALEDENLDIDMLLKKYADIIALGTIGDIVPLIGENRIFVKIGLSNIQECTRIGIAALLDDAGIKGNKISSDRLSYTIVPRINACGRMGLSEKSVKLLTTESKEESEQIAAEMGNDNRNRQNIEKEILDKINTLFAKKPCLKYDKILVISGENWHQGVIGIVASRIKELFGKPTIIISSSGELSKGSGRSIKGFSLFDAILSCKQFLLHYGGHPQAIGLSLKTSDINTFRTEINKYAHFSSAPPIPTLEIDCKLNPAMLSIDLPEELKLLEPYGAGNQAPLFGLYNMKLIDICPVGSGKHLRLKISRDKLEFTAMLFFTTQEEFIYKINDILDFAVTLDINIYNNKKDLSIIIRDIKPAELDYEPIIKSEYLYEDFILKEPLTVQDKQLLIPTREEFAIVYRYLRSNKCKNIEPQDICYKIDNPTINYGKLMVIFTALKELKLINITYNFKKITITLLPSVTKVDLQNAPIIKELTL